MEINGNGKRANISEKCCCIQLPMSDSCEPNTSCSEIMEKCCYIQCAKGDSCERVTCCQPSKILKNYIQPPKRLSFKPASSQLSTEPVEDTTVYSASYLPVETKAKVDPPWNSKHPFVQPTIPMALSTIYENSYKLPGIFKEYDKNGAKNSSFC